MDFGPNALQPFSARSQRLMVHRKGLSDESCTKALRKQSRCSAGGAKTHQPERFMTTWQPEVVLNNVIDLIYPLARYWKKR